jgi:hypothetical protein
MRHIRFGWHQSAKHSRNLILLGAEISALQASGAAVEFRLADCIRACIRLAHENKLREAERHDERRTREHQFD